MAENRQLSRKSFLTRAGVFLSTAIMSPTLLFCKKKPAGRAEGILSSSKLGFQWPTLDPFLFCVHHEDYYPQGNGRLGPAKKLLAGRNMGSDFQPRDGWRMYHGHDVPGFPGHPHRGFETITIVRRGLVDHADSLGASGRYGGGDVQWLTAGKGVQHSEMFPLLNEKGDNPLELFQIWINLPAKDKFTEPGYKMLWRETIPRVEVKDSRGNTSEVAVIAGSFNQSQAPAPPANSWAAEPAHHVRILQVKVPPRGEFTLPGAAQGINRVLYYFKGDNLLINDAFLRPGTASVLQADLAARLKNEGDEAEFLLLEAKPIGEPVVKHGPFVMNTKAEIHQAIADYRKDEFGGWPWGRHDMVHKKSLGRFARHADGSTEMKG